MLRALKSLAEGVRSVGSSALRQSLASDVYAAERERHRSILDQVDSLIPRNPPGWSIDDDTPAAQGFVPLAEAARRMALSEDATLVMCERSLLEAFVSGSVLYVRPAIVSVLGQAAAKEPLRQRAREPRPTASTSVPPV